LWVALPFAPDWRWHPLVGENIWYPFARQFRQRAPGDWDSVVAQIGGALADLKRSRDAPARQP